MRESSQTTASGFRTTVVGLGLGLGFTAVVIGFALLITIVAYETRSPSLSTPLDTVEIEVVPRCREVARYNLAHSQSDSTFVALICLSRKE